MYKAEYKETAQIKGTLYYDYPLLQLNTWRVGGVAKCYYKPIDQYDLANFLATLPKDEIITFLGLGSNLLIRDGGIRGTVIATRGQLAGLQQLDEVRIQVGAGVPSAKVAHFCQKLGLSGVEFLAGVPGTMGGALAMNAGAHGGETWDVVESVDVVNRQGNITTRKPGDYTIGYRSVVTSREEWFVSCRLCLTPHDPKIIQRTIRELLYYRAKTQPTRFFTCGSVFRNPPNHHAARLIETAGLKGLTMGGAQVSQQHANFIVNTGNATATDIENLIDKIQQIIKEKHNIELVKEVKIVGERIDENVCN